jgi:hypothetical protein
MASRRIDVHTHAMTQGVVAELAARGFKPTGGYTIFVGHADHNAAINIARRGVESWGEVINDVQSPSPEGTRTTAGPSPCCWQYQSMPQARCVKDWICMVLSRLGTVAAGPRTT